MPSVLDNIHSRSGIDILVKKPPPDLALGCPCGDAECKKKKCDPPKANKKFAPCDQRNGKAKLRESRISIRGPSVGRSVDNPFFSNLSK